MGRMSIAETGHDDGELGLEAEDKGPDDLVNELLIRFEVNRSRIVSAIEEIHRMRSALLLYR